MVLGLQKLKFLSVWVWYAGNVTLTKRAEKLCEHSPSHPALTRVLLGSKVCAAAAVLGPDVVAAQIGFR